MVKTKLITTEKRMELIDQVVQQSNLAVIEQLPSFTRGLALGRAMKQLRELVDDSLMTDIVELSESSLGFKTDRDGKGGYPKEVVKDAVIHCLLRGGSVVGNEFNIIASRCYLTKEYYERKVRELVNDLRVIEHVPHTTSGGALVGMEATWIYEGRRDAIKCVKSESGDSRIAVRVNAGMGVDAILGKAYRKLYARIHRRVTGSSWLEAEAADEPVDEPVVIEPVAAVEDSQEVVADEPQQGSPLESCRQLLEGMEQISDVDAWQAGAETLLQSDEDKVRLAEWCDWRRDQIRDMRGQRSNQRQDA